MQSKVFFVLSLCILSTFAQTNPNPWFSPTGEIPALDGFGNNIANPGLGAKGQNLVRNVPNAYPDNGVGDQQVVRNANPRTISLQVHGVTRPDGGFSPFGYSDMLTFWGQFMDHDIDLTDANRNDPAPVPIPAGDPFFDPGNTGTVTMGFNRSIFNRTAGRREQPNVITAFLDGSVIYAIDQARADALRTFTGGFMKTELSAVGELGPRTGNLFAQFPMNNAGQRVPNDRLFFFGDVRGNENLGVQMYHILFLREHNRLARKFAAERGIVDDEQLFQLARKWVRAEFQAISETQYFPLIVGPVIPPYTGYNASVDPNIRSPFSTAAFRYGHSEGNEVFYRLDENGKVIPEGNALMQFVFFDSSWLDAGLEPIIRGMMAQKQQAVDNTIVAPLRNFLYGQPGAGGFDLVIRNIQRGRDHGMPDYNTVRFAYGLDRYTDFSQITAFQPTVDALRQTYGVNGINDIDLYTGAMSEDVAPGANVGPLLQAIIRDQYIRFRDGDRFWWNQPGITFTPQEITEIRTLTLPRVILLNCPTIRRVPCNVFIASTNNNCDINGPVDDSAQNNAMSRALNPFVMIALILVAFVAKYF